MQKGKASGKSREKEQIEENLSRHWDSWIVPDKFNLRDWYYLEQEENDDMNILSISDATTEYLLDKCVKSYIDRNVISYTLQKFEGDILNELTFIRQCPKSLRNTQDISNERNDFDNIEPFPSTIDTFCCGWPLPIFNPQTVANKSYYAFEDLNQKCESFTSTATEITNDLSFISNVDNASKINSNIRKAASVKGAVRSTLSSRRKRIVSIRSPKKLMYSTLKKKMVDAKVVRSRKEETGNLEQAKVQVNKLKYSKLMLPKSMPLEVQQVAHFDLSKIESGAQTEINKSYGNMKYDSTRGMGSKPQSIKSRVGSHVTTVSVPSLYFELLDPSNFLQSHIRTGYVIKDMEVRKDSTKIPPARRIPGIPKKGSEVTAKSAATSNRTAENIFIMPSVIDKMINLENGVIARKDSHPRYSVSSQKSENRPPLKPISHTRLEPSLHISQLIDRSTIPTVSYAEETKTKNN